MLLSLPISLILVLYICEESLPGSGLQPDLETVPQSEHFPNRREFFSLYYSPINSCHWRMRLYSRHTHTNTHTHAYISTHKYTY